MMLNGYIIRFLSKQKEEIAIRIFIDCNYEIDISPFYGSPFKKPPIRRIYSYIRNNCFNIFIRDTPDFDKIYNVRVNKVVDSSKLLEILTTVINKKEMRSICRSPIGKQRLNHVIKILESYD